MKKQILASIVSLVAIFIAMPSASAEPIWEYTSCMPAYKFWDGNSNWNASQVSPVGCTVNPALKEGIDYKREYVFTTDRQAIPEDVPNWSSTAEGMNKAGFIWEVITGLGKYENSDAARHNILTAIYIYPKDITKEEGSDDPELTYTTLIHNSNPNDVTNLFDIKLTREDGEEVGTYKISATVEPKEGTPSSELVKISENGFVGDYTNGFVYFYPQTGTLTITEKQKEEEPINEETKPVSKETTTTDNSQITPPKTGCESSIPNYLNSFLYTKRKEA